MAEALVNLEFLRKGDDVLLRNGIMRPIHAVFVEDDIDGLPYQIQFEDEVNWYSYAESGRVYPDYDECDTDIIAIQSIRPIYQTETTVGPKYTGVATKNDGGKPDLSIVPRPALDAIARAMMFGSDKYGRNNYRKGFKQTRLLSAALRHITAYAFGETPDPESGLSHLDHALATLAILVTNIHEGVDVDDRN